MKSRMLTRRVLALGASVAFAGVGSVVSGSHAAGATTSVRVVSNVTYYGDPGDQLDEYLPPVTPKSPVPAVIFVHGGDWQSGDKVSWGPYAQTFVATTGWPAFSINYDMTSHKDYAIEPRDVTAALNWVKSKAKGFGVDPGRIGLVGDSAGGHLAMLAATTGTGPATGPGRVKTVVSWSGPSDLPLMAQDAGCLSTPCDPSTQWLGWDTQGFEGWTVATSQPDRWAATSPVDQVDPTDPSMLLYNASSEIIPSDQLTGMERALQGVGVHVEAHLIEQGTTDGTGDVATGTEHALGLAPYAWSNTLSWLQATLP